MSVHVHSIENLYIEEVVRARTVLRLRSKQGLSILLVDSLV